MDAAGTDISLTSPRISRPAAADLLTLTAIPGPAIGLDRLSVGLVPPFREVDEKKEVGTNAPGTGTPAALTPPGDTPHRPVRVDQKLSFETAQQLRLTV